MTLDGLMTIAMADQYTEEGRQLIEDARRYQVGEISQATGLQKQSDGSWAPPKNAQKAGSKGSQRSSDTKQKSRIDLWLEEDLSSLSDKDLIERNETLHDLGKSAKGDDFKKLYHQA